MCQAEGQLLVVRLRDPVTGVEGLYPPGGAVESGETPARAAERETLEETGIAATVIPALSVVRAYPFRWGGQDYEVTTHFFGASLERASGLPAVVDASYNLGACWLPIDEALEAMSIYPVIAAAVARTLRLANHAAWRADPRFGGPASMLLTIHDQLRVASKRLRYGATRQHTPDVDGLSRLFRSLATTLHHHHHAEEAMLFPAIGRRSGLPPERLVRDHQTLTTAIAGVERSLSADTVAHFDDILQAHLDREERLAMPFLLELSAREAWALFG